MGVIHIASDCKQHCGDGELVSAEGLCSPAWGRLQALSAQFLFGGAV